MADDLLAIDAQARARRRSEVTLRILWRALAALLVQVAVFTANAAGQSLPSKKEAEKLVETWRATRPLSAGGTSPFHLLAEMNYRYNGHEVTGKYELLWAARERYREEFRMGPASETDIALGKQYFFVRNTAYPTYQLLSARSLLSLPDAKRAPGEVPSIRSISAGANGGFCVELDSHPLIDTVCFDQNRQPISERITHKAAQREVLFEDVADFGSTRFAKHRIEKIGDAALEISVAKLNPVSTFDEGIFAPPPNANARNWCADPAMQAGNAGIFPLVTSPGSGKSDSKFFYVLVAPDGHAEKYVQMYPSGETVERRVQDSLSKGWFPTRKCDGMPVEYDMFLGFFPR